jgi:hypothetical protein
VIPEKKNIISQYDFFIDIIWKVYILILMEIDLITNEEGMNAIERLRQIKPFLQGSLSVTKKRCGNPRCRCAQEGPIHEVSLLTWKEKNRTRTLYVPIELRQEVDRWVQEGKLLKRLVAEVSRTQREFLTAKKKSRKG